MAGTFSHIMPSISMELISKVDCTLKCKIHVYYLDMVCCSCLQIMKQKSNLSLNWCFVLLYLESLKVSSHPCPCNSYMMPDHYHPWLIDATYVGSLMVSRDLMTVAGCFLMPPGYSREPYHGEPSLNNGLPLYRRPSLPLTAKNMMYDNIFLDYYYFTNSWNQRSDALLHPQVVRYEAQTRYNEKQ